MMKKNVSITTLFLCCILVFIATYAIPKLGKKETSSVPSFAALACDNKMDQLRLRNFKLIKPLLLTDVREESSSLLPIRDKIEQYIRQAKSNQQAEEISVYFRRLNDGSWFSINPNETYNPASMSKIIYLITFLKDSENNPEILNKKIFFTRHFSEVTQQNIKNFELKENAYYTIKELLTYMIKYSDNDATVLLYQNMNLNIFKQLFKDFNIPSPPEFGEYYITTADFSKLFRVLFSATYVRPDLSEYGLELLTTSTYNDGLRKGVDPSVTIAHKFGERIMGNKSELHEFGIVFIDNDPYLIGVMTKGNSLPQLSGIVGEISRIAYTDYLSRYRI